MADKCITASEVQRNTGLTPQRLSSLVARGIIPKTARGRYPWPEANKAYIDHLERVAAGRGGADGNADLSKERALLAREQRRGHELKNSVTAGELIPAIDVEIKWSGILSAIRSQMLGLPSVIAAALPLLTRADIDVIDREIRDALNQAADCIGADR